MIKIKKEKQASTQPLQMKGSMEQVADAARENLTGLIVGFVLLVVVAGAVVGFIWMRQQDDQAAEDLFHDGMQVFSQGTPIPLPPTREQLLKAAETFRKVIADHPRSAVAAQAAYMLGNALSDLKDWEGAAKAYQEFLLHYGDRKVLNPLVYQRLAYAQLAQGKVDDAEKTLNTVTKLPGAPNKDQALYELAKIDEVLSRPEGALAHYQELIKDHPHSPFAEEAAMRLKTLEARKSSTQPAPGAQGPPGSPQTQPRAVPETAPTTK